MNGIKSVSGQNYTFIENKGQWNSGFVFASELENASFYAEKGGFTYLFSDGAEYGRMMHDFHENKFLTDSFNVRYHSLKMQFIGQNNEMKISGKNALPFYNNYFYGNDRSKWKSYVPIFENIYYTDAFKGVDLSVYSSPSNLKYDYIVNAGADVSEIRFRYEGADYITLKGGYLYIGTSLGDLVESKPFAYQLINGEKVTVQCNYSLTDNSDPNKIQVSFKTGVYNKNYALIIDPVLIFSTYSGSRGDNFGFTATYDHRANLYSAGITNGGPGKDYPVTFGAFQKTYKGGVNQAPANLPCDVTISKYDSTGKTLLFATYLGGTLNEFPHSLVADNQNNLLIMGTTFSKDFPVHQLGYDTSHNGNADIFVCKLSSDGSTLLGGTFIGGNSDDGLNSNTLRYNYSDDFRGDIIPDSLNHVYVASTTESSNFPLKNASQTTKGSKQDGCVFSLDSSLRILQWSTFLGGNSDDACYSVKLNDSSIYVGGGTASTSLSSIATAGTTTYQGGRADGFFARLTKNGSIDRFSYFGTSAYDQVYFIEFDDNGKLYAAGQTEGNIPRTSKTYGKDNTSQFIVRYSNDFSTQSFATTIGFRTNNPEFSPSAFLVDKCFNIYLSGWGSDISYDGLHGNTTKNLPVSVDALQKTTDDNDFYLIVLGRNAESLLHATYFGGNQTEDHVDGGTSRFDKNGVVYQAVCASCPSNSSHYNDFPITPGAAFSTNFSPRCSNAAFKIDFQITFQVDASFTATPKKGCGPLSVIFTNTSRKGRKFFWDFGDGSAISNDKNPVHDYTKQGKYKVFLTTVDSFSCNISETDSTEIEVLPSPVADFVLESSPCSYEVTFKNNSTDYTNPIWKFGDSTTSTDTDPKHKYVTAGKYKVTLTVKSTASDCIDTAELSVNLFPDPLQSLKIPNIFTPNADNINDCYTVEGINPECSEVKIRIYDRWGILVFKGNLPQQCWNGRIMSTGPLVSDGVYYYLIDVYKNNSTAKQKPDVQINGVIHIVSGK
ncbi:MAG: gliding motility-associated C-terminal domain-containing protein [Bacteroidia bacterium]|nr:gliding motility-associated C-terminal domain-containing protein [Bacteroidia bacterium]